MNIPNNIEHSSDNNLPDMIQREEKIAKEYHLEMDILRQLIKELRDETISVKYIGHHLGNALSSVCGDENYGIKGIEEGEHFISVFSRCNNMLLDMSLEKRKQHCKELTNYSSAYQTSPYNEINDFYGARKLYEKIFDLAGENKDTEISKKTLDFMSQLDINQTI